MSGALGDDDELDDDDDDDEEDDKTDDVVASHHQLAKRGDELAGVGLGKDEAGGGHVERQAVQSQHQQQAGEHRQLQGCGDVDGQHQDQQRHADVERQEKIQRVRGERDDHHHEDGDDAYCQGRVGVLGQFFEPDSHRSTIWSSHGRSGSSHGRSGYGRRGSGGLVIIGQATSSTGEAVDRRRS